MGKGEGMTMMIFYFSERYFILKHAIMVYGSQLLADQTSFFFLSEL